MPKIIIFGNSASGKSTMAKKLAQKHQLAHLDLDTLAWLPTNPPQRASLTDSIKKVEAFTNNNQSWVIEGCYADLLTHVSSMANEAIFMDIPVDQCQKNAKARPWEPHKYKSKADQDSNLPMLLEWIAAYETRNDEFSHSAHWELYNSFSKNKKRLTTNS